MSGELAKVVAVYWESHTVDLIFMTDGRTARNVRVQSSSASTNTGLSDIPKPDSSGDYAKAGITKTRDILACVDFYGGIPVVTGFLFPQNTQIAFAGAAHEERKIDRHASDVYETIDKNGNYELYHPSGAYLRIGTAPAHEDLTGKDFDKKWKIARNTDKQVHLHIEQAGGKATVDIAPNGDIKITTATTVTVNATGNATVTSGANVEVNASGTAKVIAGGKATVKGSAIDLDAGVMMGVVQGSCLCAFTGAPHGQFSATVKASV